MAHEKITKSKQKDSNSNFIIKRDSFMNENNIEMSPLSKLYYNQLKANGTHDDEMIDKMKARGY